jgi:hypothetical protein
LGGDLEGVDDFLAGEVALEKIGVGAEDLAGLGGGFIEEFDPEAAGSGIVKRLKKGGAALGFVMEEGVAATDIGFQEVINAHPVA